MEDDQSILPFNILPERDQNPNQNLNIDKDFNEIKLLFDENQSIVAITGFENTCFLNQLSYRFAFSTDYYVYWFNAFDLEKELKKFIQKIDKEPKNDNLVEDIYDHFELIKNKNTRVLLIIDGIINEKAIEKFIAKKVPDSIRILFTSRVEIEDLKTINEKIIVRNIQKPIDHLQKNILLSMGDGKFRILNNLKSNKFEDVYLAEEESENSNEKYGLNQ